MKLSKNTVIVFIILVVVAAIYRIFPERPFGFAPQMALALFGGAMITEKKWAFLLPLLSLFISDVLYQGLYAAGINSVPGFYEGQVWVYVSFLMVTVFGFLMKNVNWKSVLGFSVSGSMIFFL